MLDHLRDLFFSFYPCWTPGDEPGGGGESELEDDIDLSDELGDDIDLSLEEGEEGQEPSEKDESATALAELENDEQTKAFLERKLKTKSGERSIRNILNDAFKGYASGISTGDLLKLRKGAIQLETTGVMPHWLGPLMQKMTDILDAQAAEKGGKKKTYAERLAEIDADEDLELDDKNKKRAQLLMEALEERDKLWEKRFERFNREYGSQLSERDQANQVKEIDARFAVEEADLLKARPHLKPAIETIWALRGAYRDRLVNRIDEVCPPDPTNPDAQRRRKALYDRNMKPLSFFADRFEGIRKQTARLRAEGRNKNDYSASGSVKKSQRLANVDDIPREVSPQDVPRWLKEHGFDGVK